MGRSEDFHSIQLHNATLDKLKECSSSGYKICISMNFVLHYDSLSL